MTREIAILHDQFRTLGGAERVGIEMARALDAPIFAARVDEGVAPPDVDVHELFDGLAARAMRRHWLAADLAQTLTWQHQPDIWDYDVVICNKTNPLWYQPRDHQTVLGYLHSTPRGFYDQFDKRGGGIATAMFTVMRTLFETNRTSPDAWACNSELVERRADLYWDRQRDVDVIYPPVDVKQYNPDDEETRDYYLSIGRLANNKRVPDIAKAFAGTGPRLVIAGDGGERDKLEAIAAGESNIEVLGYVSESEKRRLMAGAKAFVMNAECEDFGITPIEAMAAGTPVIGVAEGFTRCQINDGTTGILYERGHLLEAIHSFEREGVRFGSEAIAESVAHLDSSRFVREITEWVNKHQERTEITADVTESGRESSSVALTDGGDHAADE